MPSDLEQMVGKAEQLAEGRRGVLIDVTRVSQLDTFGAWFIERMRRSYAAGRRGGEGDGAVADLFAADREVSRVQKPEEDQRSRLTSLVMLEQVGRAVGRSGKRHRRNAARPAWR